jgi:hypothetical protein
MTLPFLRRSLSAGALVACASMLASSRARAEDTLELVWEAPEECPNGEAVSNQVRSLAGESLRERHLRATGHIERHGARYQLTLTLRRGDEVRERKMESTSCDDLAGAAAVALDLLLRKDPAAATSAGDGTADNRTTADRTSKRATSASTVPRTSSDRRTSGAPKPGTSSSPDETDGVSGQRRWNVLLRAPFGTADLGLFSRPTLALGVGLGFRYAEWRVMAEGRIFKHSALWSAILPNVGARVDRVAAEVDGCREWRAGRLVFGPCLNLGLSFIDARGRGTHVAPASQHAFVFALGAGAEGRVFLTSWADLFAAATIAAETSRPKLSITEFGEIVQLGPVDFSLALGAEWIF